MQGGWTPGLQGQQEPGQHHHCGGLHSLEVWLHGAHAGAGAGAGAGADQKTLERLPDLSGLE